MIPFITLDIYTITDINIKSRSIAASAFFLRIGGKSRDLLSPHALWKFSWSIIFLVVTLHSLSRRSFLLASDFYAG